MLALPLRDRVGDLLRRRDDSLQLMQIRFVVLPANISHMRVPQEKLPLLLGNDLSTI